MLRRLTGYNGIAKLDRKDLGALALLLVIALLPFADSIFSYSGWIVGHRRGDASLFFYFAYGFGADGWASGQIPLWNPYIKLGYPFHGEGQGGVFYPFTALFVLFETGRALNLFLALHFALSGLFFYRYLRLFEIRREASALATLVLLYSSMFVGRFQAGHFTIVTGLTWSLALLLSWEGYRKTRRPHWLLLFSASYALLFLSGSPNIALIFSLFIALYSVVGAIHDIGVSEDRRAALRRELGGLVWLGASTALGLGIAMVSFLPALLYAGISFRQEITYAFASTYSFAPEQLLTVLYPSFFGEASQPYLEGEEVAPYFGRYHLWESWLYIGIAPLLAALLGWLEAPRRVKALLGIPLLCFLVIAFGHHTPVHRFLFEHVPLFGYLRAPNRYLTVVIVCLATLAAFGFQRWLAGEPERGSRLLAGGFGASVLLLSGTLVWWFGDGGSQPDGNWSRFLGWMVSQEESLTSPSRAVSAAFLAKTWGNAHQELLRSSILAALSVALFFSHRRLGRRPLCALLLYALVMTDLGLFFSRYLYRFPEARITAYTNSLPPQLRDPQGVPPRVAEFSLLQNMAMAARYSGIGGYTGNSLDRYNRFLNLSQEQAVSEEAFLENFSPLLYLTSLDFLLLPTNEVSPEAEQIVFRDDTFTLLELPKPVPRAYLASSASPVSSPEEALRRLLVRAPIESVESPLVEGTIEQVQGPPLGPEEGVSFTEFRLNEITLSVRSAAPRLLVVNEMYHPGWKATVDGVPATVHPCNYLFRAVAVPPGNSVVKLSYTPPAYTVGRTVSLLSLSLWILLLAGVLAYRGGKDEEKSVGSAKGGP